MPCSTAACSIAEGVAGLAGRAEVDETAGEAIGYRTVEVDPHFLYAYRCLDLEQAGILVDEDLAQRCLGWGEGVELLVGVIARIELEEVD